ncbi:MAG TPA: hypothetical protein VIV66_18245 [Pyrinomonadaceae bacterium]
MGLACGSERNRFADGEVDGGLIRDDGTFAFLNEAGSSLVWRRSTAEELSLLESSLAASAPEVEAGVASFGFAAGEEAPAKPGLLDVIAVRGGAFLDGVGRLKR